MKDVFSIVENNEEQSHSTDRVEEKTKGTQKKHRIRKGILIFIMVILIYDLLWFAGMHISFNGYYLPEGAQVVLRPNIGHFSGCSCGNYTSIEMVYKIPEERIAEVEFGNIKNGFNVEPFNIQTTNIHFTGIEGRCGYVYDPNYPERYEAYTENDGNVYVHVDRVVYHGGYDENPLTIPLLLFDFI